MRILLLLIILASFLQSAFLSVNLVLVIIIARTLYLESRENLWLAFFSGIVLSFLTQSNLGYWPLVLIFITKAGQMLKKLPVSFNPLMIFLTGLLLIIGAGLLNMHFIDEKFNIVAHIFEAILILPAYFLVKLWDERFDVKRAIRLKV